MRKFFIGLAPALVIVAIVAWPYLMKDTVSFAPRWKIGQTWKLQVFSDRGGDGPSPFYQNIWVFKVRERDEVDGRTEYTIAAWEAERKSGVGYEFRLSYPDLVLRRMTIYQDTKPVKKLTSKSKTFFLDAREPSLMPLDFSPLPTFKLRRADRTRELTVRSAHVFSGVTQMSEMRQQVPVSTPVRKLDVMMTTNLKGGGQLETLQRWDYDKPWWSGARRMRNGVKESEATLVEW